MCVLLVPQVKKCESRRFVISMSKNLSTNLYHRLQRLTISCNGLHFDLPSQYSCRTQSLLLWTPIRIPPAGYLDTARSIKLLYVRSPFKALKINQQSLTTKIDLCSIFTFISNGSAKVHLIDFWFTRSMWKCHMHA